MAKSNGAIYKHSSEPDKVHADIHIHRNSDTSSSHNFF